MMKENKKSDNQKNKGETVDRPSDCKGLRIVTRLIILFVTAAAVIAFMLIGSCSLVVRFYHIPAPAPAYTAEKAPDTVRIAALTDLHGRMIGENQGKIVGRVREIRPDLIVCLGDMVDRSRAEESRTAYTALVKQLTAIAPVYYVDGNH
jgi:predicted MPP superfamily phosphohydrolase